MMCFSSCRLLFEHLNVAVNGWGWATMPFFEWRRELMSYFQMRSRDEKGWEPLNSNESKDNSTTATPAGHLTLKMVSCFLRKAKMKLMRCSSQVNGTWYSKCLVESTNMIVFCHYRWRAMVSPELLLSFCDYQRKDTGVRLWSLADSLGILFWRFSVFFLKERPATTVRQGLWKMTVRDVFV